MEVSDSGHCRSGWRRAAILFFVVALASGTLASADDFASWRLWGHADGVTDGYTPSMTRSPAGKLITRHGGVSPLTIIDGYSAVTVPDPISFGRTYQDARGDLYTFDSHGIVIFRQSAGQKHWSSIPIPKFAEFDLFNAFRGVERRYSGLEGFGVDRRIAAIPIAPGRLVILLPDQLLEWTDGTPDLRVIGETSHAGIGQFVDLQPKDETSSANSLWVSGEHGVGILSWSRGEYSWHQLPPLPPGLTRPLFPAVVAGSDSFIASTSGADGKSNIVQNTPDGWKVVYAARQPRARAWSGSDETIWIADGSSLLTLANGQVRSVPRPAEIAGAILDVIPESHGVYWLSTGQKLGRYAPPLWQTPPDIPDADDTIGVITTDAAGRTWFGGITHLLVRESTGAWRTWTLPPGEERDPSGTLFPVPGGMAMVAVERDHLLVLNTADGSFRSVRHPKGRYFGRIQFAGNVPWLQTREPAGKTSRIETFDGHRFTPVPGLDSLPQTDSRAFLQAKDGTIWLGSPNALTTVKNGKVRELSTQDGLSETNGLSLLEGPNGEIYIGQIDAVEVFDGKTFHTLRKGLERARSMVMMPDGTLWIASGTGIHRYSYGMWITNAAEEGLPAAASYSVHADRYGRIWAGTTRGIGIFHPEADTEPPVTAMREDRNSTEVSPGGQVILNFFARDQWKFTSEDRMLYSWRLDGQPWSPFDSASFTGFHALQAGSHLFEVRSMDRNGNIDTHPASFPFAVLFPWYRATGFYAFAGLGTLLLAIVIRTAFHYHANLKFRSTHDPLTGLANRAEFENQLERAASGEQQVAVVFIDLDGFKYVNDTYGHKAGDALLIQVSRAISACLRSADSLARLGGDEFTIILRDIHSRAEAAMIVDQILHSIRACSVPGEGPARVSASIGISMYPNHSRDASTLLRLADFAMYQCKAHKKDRRLFYDTSMNKFEIADSEITATP